MMGKLIEQIQSLGYYFIEGEPILSVPSPEGGFIEINRLSVSQIKGGQTMILKHDDSPTMFPGGQAFRHGIPDSQFIDSIKTTCGAIYKDYYALDDNGYSLLLYSYSSRTKAYLDSEKARIGLIDYKEGMPEEFFSLVQYTIGRGIGLVDAGKYADGRFVVQSSKPLFAEDYVLRMHFTRFPSQQDIEDAVIIHKMEYDFKQGRHREVFCCNDCGEIKHWLDIEGPIERKLAMRLQRVCGCKKQ